MRKESINEEKEVLLSICQEIRALVKQRNYTECEVILQSAIGKYPHSSEPHNLYGVLYEEQGDHVAAMKHFRAAWALDPTYLPARFNIEQYSTFYSKISPAYDETDCPKFEQKTIDKKKSYAN